MRKAGGFTLLEILMAITLMVTGFVVLLQVMATGLFAGGEVERDLVAINLAQERIEQARNTAFAGIAAEARAPVAGFTSFEREVAIATPIANLKEVTVTVYWHTKSAELNVSLVTYVSDI